MPSNPAERLQSLVNDFQEKVGFAIGTGRCGTKFLAKVIELEPGISSVHERNPINETFHRYYHDDPRHFLAEYQFDVPRVIHALQREKKHFFPYLGGLKLSNYWLFILSEFTELELQQTHEISIIPDTHVVKSTIELGLLSGNPSPLQVEQVWRQALKELGVPPGEMHAALWRWSRNRFSPSIVLS
jgi:hypothetical protein